MAGDDVALSIAYLHDMSKDELISSAESLLRQLTESEARQAKLEKDLEEREGRMLDQLRTLEAEIEQMEGQQVQRYRNITEVLEENFRSVGVVENRLDDMLARYGDGMVGNSGFAKRALWTILDVFANGRRKLSTNNASGPSSTPPLENFIRLHRPAIFLGELFSYRRRPRTSFDLPSTVCNRQAVQPTQHGMERYVTKAATHSVKIQRRFGRQVVLSTRFLVCFLVA